jgi:hypothetical protein
LSAQLRAVNSNQPIWRVRLSCLSPQIGCLTLEIICSSSSALDRIRLLVEARGFEPLTSGLQSPRSAKLSYAPKATKPAYLRLRLLMRTTKPTRATPIRMPITKLSSLDSNIPCLRGWLRGRDLNPRPLGYEPNELPDCSTPRQFSQNVVGLGRVELPTSRLSGVRSNQLSYRPSVSFAKPFSAAKKSHTSNQRVRFVLTVNRLEGPCSFGGLISFACDLLQ